MRKKVLLLVVFAAMGVAVLIAAVWDLPDEAGLFLAIVTLLLWLFSAEYSALAERTETWLAERPYSRLAAPLKRIASALTYSDLSLILLGVLLLCVWLFNSFVEDIRDLAAKGFLSYDPKMAGFVHLQIYITGYLILPPFLLVGGAYGFNRGMKDGRVSFGRLLVAILLGFLAAVLLLSLVRGDFAGLENKSIIVDANSGSVPRGAEAFSPTNLVGAGLMMWLGYAAFAWGFGWLGRLARRIALRTVAENDKPEPPDRT